HIMLLHWPPRPASRNAITCLKVSKARSSRPANSAAKSTAGKWPVCRGCIVSMPDRYAVIGNPVAHSKSPLIHQAFATQMAQDITYERVLAPLEQFAETVLALREAGYK